MRFYVKFLVMFRKEAVKQNWEIFGHCEIGQSNVRLRTKENGIESDEGQSKKKKILFGKLEIRIYIKT